MKNKSSRCRAASLTLVLLLAHCSFPSRGNIAVFAQRPAGKAIDWPAYQELAVDLMRRYLRLNTSNPPGNELLAANFFKEIFDRERIPCEVFEYQPGRANVIARLKGDGSQRPLILLSHTDVVTADPAQWRADPFAAEVIDGSFYGRGALDMKGVGLLQLMTMIVLARERTPLSRDVIFLATADEEVLDTGSLWMIANKASLFKDAEYLLTEGGENLLEGGSVKYVGVDVAEKAPYWLQLTATGQPGHGSRPIPDSAPNRLARAMAKIVAHQTPLKVLPAVEKFFRDVAPLQPGSLRAQFADFRAALADPRFVARITNSRDYNYALRNTISLTMMEGSKQTNVIPNVATCNLDVRLLPGENPDDFVAELKRVIDDPTITITPLRKFKVPNSSPLDTELFQIISQVTKTHHPEAIVTTKLMSGYTESQLYRELGIVAYGWAPVYTTAEENSTVHGNNERITVKNVREGTREFYEVVAGIAAQKDK